MKLRRLVLSVCVAAALVAAFSASPASAAGSRHVFPGTKPGWTKGVAGTASGSQHLSAYVWLTARNSAQRDALAAAVSDPSSASYRQFLTSAQYQAAFAPSAAQVNDVSAWLKGSGLHVDAVGAGNAYLLVSGSASAMNAAFDTEISNYVVNGKTEQAPSRDLSVPDSVAGEVDAVLGLATLGHRTSPAFSAPSGFVNAGPCSSYYGQEMATNLPQFNGQTLPYAVCGYVPSQYRNVYGVTASGRTGAGQTVAITDAYDSVRLMSDANQYATNRGDQPFARGQLTDLSVPENVNTGSACGGNGWYGEQNLDVEAVHGMSPSANVRYYGAASCYDSDLLAQLNQVVVDNVASIVTNSWGEPTFVGPGVDGCPAGTSPCETIDQSLINAYESVFKQGAMQGIGFQFSSGDFGDELADVGYKHPDFPTGDPWVTSVGGTSLAIGQSGSRLFETGWGTSQWRLNSAGTAWTNNVAPFQYGAGGGFSQIFPEPSWQQGVVTNNPTGGRAVPDIAMDGDPNTGMLIGITQDFSAQTIFGQGTKYGEYRIGGTSLASPLFAGLEADTQQGRGRLGFAAPLIYSLFHKKMYFDVTPEGDLGNIRADYNNGLNGSNGVHFSVRTFDQDSSLLTTNGWDDVTGVGSATGSFITGALGS